MLDAWPTVLMVAVLALAAGLAPAPARAADTVKPGKWEFTSQLQAPAMPQPPSGASLPSGVQPRPGGGVSASHTSCVEPDKAVPTDPRPECKIERMTRNGGSVSWATICTSPRGEVRSEGVAHYAGNTMEATLTTHIPQPGGPEMQTRQRITGRYLGPCTK